MPLLIKAAMAQLVLNKKGNTFVDAGGLTVAMGDGKSVMVYQV